MLLADVVLDPETLFSAANCLRDRADRLRLAAGRLTNPRASMALRENAQRAEAQARAIERALDRAVIRVGAG